MPEISRFFGMPGRGPSSWNGRRFIRRADGRLGIGAATGPPESKLTPWSNTMLQDIVAVQPLEPYRLMLRFEDGAEGVIDVQQLVSFSGVFAALSSPEEFASFQVHPELGTVYWPCGADL